MTHYETSKPISKRIKRECMVILPSKERYQITITCSNRAYQQEVPKIIAKNDSPPLVGSQTHRLHNYPQMKEPI